MTRLDFIDDFICECASVFVNVRGRVCSHTFHFVSFCLAVLFTIPIVFDCQTKTFGSSAENRKKKPKKQKKKTTSTHAHTHAHFAFSVTLSYFLSSLNGECSTHVQQSAAIVNQKHLMEYDKRCHFFFFAPLTLSLFESIRFFHCCYCCCCRCRVCIRPSQMITVDPKRFFV